MTETNDTPKYDVVWPLGSSRVDRVEPGNMPTDLNGKTIGFIWDFLFRGPEMFDAIKAGILERFPGAKFVDYEIFGNIHGSAPEERANLEALPTVLRAHKTDLVVAAVGA